MPAPLSVIIPTLDAAEDLPSCLESLLPGLASSLIREVLIVDGGSTDKTCAIAEHAGCTVIPHTPGRGAQLKAGAEAAKGAWFLFLHADTALSPDWTERADTHRLDHPGMAAAFTLTYRSDAPEARWLAKRANWRARWLGLPYGDQGLLLPRTLYDAVGGYSAQPLMEDVAIVRAIGKARLRLLSAQARTSATKYERDGWRRRAYHNAWLLVRYAMGASPEKLARLYR